MDMKAKRQYLETLVGRYLKSPRRGKGALLDEYCRNTGQNRKYVIRKIAGLAFGLPRIRKKRKAFYGSEVRGVLEMLWRIFDYPCGQRLKPLITTELGRLRTMGELRVTERAIRKLLRVSPATIDRLLSSKKQTWKLQKRYGRLAGNLIAKRIPLRMTDWDTSQVGYVEMDLVCHCGASLAGDYISTLSTLEIASGWWEGEAVLGRAQPRVFQGLRDIRSRSPFLWRGIDSDNDNMFINHQLYRYAWKELLEFTRSRAYRKNDNAYIEQKNFTHVRKPLGYLRYDTLEELAVIQDLYRNELRLYKNFFQPVMKLKRKDRIGGQVKRVYDVPKTPCQRLLESKQLSPEQARDLRRVYESLNPAELKRRIDQKLAKLYSLYEKKKKRPVIVNPYKKLEPSMVTFFVSQ
jgi:hypothetical protein